MRARAAGLALLCTACASVNVDARSFEGTSWRVVAINGQATPGGDSYRLDFERGKLGGRFGCNSFGGRYTASAGILTAHDIAATLMGCPQPAATFESAGFSVLAAPMQLRWTSGTRVSLTNAAGSLELERSP